MQQDVGKMERVILDILKEEQRPMEGSEIFERYQESPDRDPEVFTESQLNVAYWNLVSKGHAQFDGDWMLELRK